MLAGQVGESNFPAAGESEKSVESQRPHMILRQIGGFPPTAPFTAPPGLPSGLSTPFFGPAATLGPPPGFAPNFFPPGDRTGDGRGGASTTEGGQSIETSNKLSVPTTSTTTRSIPLQSIEATTTDPNPFDLTTSVASFRTSTPAGFYSSDSALSILESTYVSATETQGPLSTSDVASDLALATSTSDVPPISTSITSVTSSALSTSPASMATTTALPQASNHPIAQAAVIVPLVLGMVAGIAIVYLLFRYCGPIRSRWMLFRARRGQRIPEVEDGTIPSAPAQMTDAYATRTGATFPHSRSLPPTPGTSAPSYIEGTALALPLTSTRAYPPVLVREFSNHSVRNIYGSHIPDNHGIEYNRVAGRHASNAPNFSLPQNPVTGGTFRHSRHPSGLDGNPTDPAVVHTVPGDDDFGIAGTQARGLSATDAESGRGMTFPQPPKTPLPVHLRPKTPPESVIDDSPPRMRKSITPSESVSNIPDSPLSLSPGLRPPVPVVDSRWSRNSSSLHGRLLAEAMNVELPNSLILESAAPPRRLSRFPSL